MEFALAGLQRGFSATRVSSQGPSITSHIPILGSCECSAVLHLARGKRALIRRNSEPTRFAIHSRPAPTYRIWSTAPDSAAFSGACAFARHPFRRSGMKRSFKRTRLMPASERFRARAPKQWSAGESLHDYRKCHDGECDGDDLPAPREGIWNA